MAIQQALIELRARASDLQCVDLMFGVGDVALQCGPPVGIRDLVHVVTVVFQRLEVFAVVQAMGAVDLDYAERQSRRMKCRCYDDASNVVDRNHVYGVVDVWTFAQLDTALG